MLLLTAFVISKTGTDLFFVRHGETLANSSGHYSAATLNRFSPKGQKEVDALTEELLKQPRFEMILVSPSPRALYTIAPYLKKSGQRAIVWPLLYECCTGKPPKNARATSFKYGPKIQIPPEFKNQFNFLTKEKQLPVAPSYDEGLAQVNQAVDEFNRFCRGRRVLLVGHSGQGGHFLHTLTGRWKKLDNAKLYELRLP